MRLLAWALAFALSIASVGAAAIAWRQPTPEQLVEGHTVWATITAVPNATQEQTFAAAVAVLVRDRTQKVLDQRFPGVLWFNDQYLVEPKQREKKDRVKERYPCTGAVIAVNAGDPVDRDAEGHWTLSNATYENESYFITDPNEHVWVIDLWNTTSGTRAWTVTVEGYTADADVRSAQPDDGKCQGAVYNDMRPCYSSTCSADFFPDPLRYKSPGDNGMDYPCDGCKMLKYNAVLYFRLEHLRMQNVSKDHRENVGADWFDDAAGCQADVTNSWPCPGGDDSREGNSHPYNPDLGHPFLPYDGRDNHGGSVLCADGSDRDCHSTFDIDVYFGYATPPLVRTFWLVDTAGADAPYHCHDDIMYCSTYDYEP